MTIDHIKGQRYRTERHEERDLAILKSLYAGISTRKYLRKEHGKDPYTGKYLTEARFGIIINRLNRDGFIKIYEYPRIKGKSQPHIIQLTELGYIELAQVYNVDPDAVDFHAPRKSQIAHDLIVADVIRVMHKERDNSLYKIDFAYNDRALWSLTKEGRKNKGLSIPDIRARLIPGGKPPLILNIEIDCGTMKRWQWIRRAKLWSQDIVLVIAMANDRMEQLIALASKEKEKTANWGFATYDVFKEHGFSHTAWWWPAAKRSAVLPLR